MFFHIPTPEWEYAEADTKNILVGSKGEGIGCPHLNSGLFTTVHAQGDVNGIFCGHDHDNDFAVGYKISCWLMDGIPEGTRCITI